jgi:benzoylformate decarboxylase
MTRPYGPAFVSVPEDDWEREVPMLAVRHVFGDFVADAAALDALAEVLDGARSPALVVGAGVDRDRAAGLVVRLAETLRAPVWASALVSRCGFPEDHPLFAGALPRIRRGVVETLRGHDVVVVLGAPVFNYHVHSEGPYVEEGTTVFQLTDDPNAASYAAVGTSILTALRPALEHLLPRLTPSSRPLPEPRARPAASASDPIRIAYVLQALGETMPSDAIIAEETPAVHTVLHDFGLLRPGAYFAAASGSLGYGLPAAIGAALAAPGRRIVALIGDGSAHYGIQALWTAVEQRLPITFVIVNNEGYGAMNSFAELMGSQRSPSFAIPHVDFCALARGYGCQATLVDRAAALVPALEESFRSEGPVLLDVRVESTAPRLF